MQAVEKVDEADEAELNIAPFEGILTPEQSDDENKGEQDIKASPINEEDGVPPANQDSSQQNPFEIAKDAKSSE